MDQNIPTSKSLENKIGGYFLLFALLLTIFVVFEKSGAVSGSQSPATIVNSNINSASLDNSNTHIVNLYVQGSQYILEPSTFKVGVPLKLVADISKMPGCSKSIVISAFNIRKTLTSSDNTITFTPTQAGTFNIACSMNMYRGTFTVQNSDGSNSNYVEKSSASSGGSCGGSSGGCGCGGGN